MHAGHDQQGSSPHDHELTPQTTKRYLKLHSLNTVTQYTHKLWLWWAESGEGGGACGESEKDYVQMRSEQKLRSPS